MITDLIKKKVEEYEKNLMVMPPGKYELGEFATQLLTEFIDKLKKEKTTVKWNYGLDEVVFLEDLELLEEVYIGKRNDQSDNDESP